MIFILISLMIDGVEHLFDVLIGHMYIFFGKMCIQILCPIFLIGLLGFLKFSFMSSL